jgi:hypothetical protein
LQEVLHAILAEVLVDVVVLREEVGVTVEAIVVLVESVKTVLVQNLIRKHCFSVALPA